MVDGLPPVQTRGGRARAFAYFATAVEVRTAGMSATTDVHLERTIPGVGLIEFAETEKSRAYWFTPEGAKRRQRMPSVTGILRSSWPKPALLEWYAKHGAHTETLLEEASQRGKAVHKFVEVYMTTGEVMDVTDFPPAYRPYLSGIARFIWDYDPQPLAVERLIVHPEMRYAGRLDLVAGVRDVVTLLDFKSNPRGRVYTEAHVQATAYAIANERCGDGVVDQIMVIGISDTGDYNPVVATDAAKLWGAVLAFYGELRKFERALGEGEQ